MIKLRENIVPRRPVGVPDVLFVGAVRLRNTPDFGTAVDISSACFLSLLRFLSYLRSEQPGGPEDED